MKYRLGTRKSLLAQTQSNWVKEKLESFGVYCELVIVESQGDVEKSAPLYEIETERPGLFTKNLEDALLREEIDLAVHSLKDLPTSQPPGLRVGAIPTRADASDCLLIHEGAFQSEEILYLPKGARVGTSSLRREALILSQRPDITIVPIRGNLPTRIRQVQERALDAVVLAAAGINRTSLEMKGVRRWDLPADLFVPAPGQGALAVEIRETSDSHLLEGLAKLQDETAAQETRVERAVLKGLFGGCTLPLGVKCRVDGNGLSLKAFIGVSKDRKAGKHEWKGFHHFDISDASEQSLISKTIQHLKGYMDG